MRKILLFFALALTPSIASAQVKVSQLPAANPLVGTEQMPVVQSAVTKAATAEQLRAYAAKTKQGVINVRTIYGAVPDGSTDNSTAIASAFTAANAYPSNSPPAVYFDCDTSSTTCVFGGSGISPINPTRAMIIFCAPGVTLNYTGTTHAADIGSVGMTYSTMIQDRVAIRDCRWTGGANSAAGLYFNDFVTIGEITGNDFYSFGNTNGQTFAIVLTGNDWDYDISHNVFKDHDGIVRGAFDAHLAYNNNVRFLSNQIDCLTAAGLGCAIPPAGTGVGIWAGGGQFEFNQILAHYPAVRISSAAFTSGINNTIGYNQIEGNPNGTSPAITYGDPGGPGNLHSAAWRIVNNMFYWPTTGNVNWIAPEMPASGLFYIDNLTMRHNWFAGQPNGTTAYIKTNGNSSDYYYHNFNNSGEVNQTTTNPLFDTSMNSVVVAGVSVKRGFGGAIAGAVPEFGSNGTTVNVAGFNAISNSLLCVGSASGTANAQKCTLSVGGDASGTAYTPNAGTITISRPVQTNTGPMTLTIGSGSVINIKRADGTTDPAAGVIANVGAYVLVFDGTNWRMTY